MHQKGHKSLFDYGTMAEKYISHHLYGRESGTQNKNTHLCLFI